jgi:uncharacterized membrane protein
MIPLSMSDMQIIIGASLFVLGCMCILLGTFVLISRGFSKEMKALAVHTARIGQKGIAEELSGLVNSASELVVALNQLVKSASGAGIFLVSLGMAMIAAAYWVLMQIEWPATAL